MFINLSNHKSDSWSREQIAEAQSHGEIIDIPFPSIDPEISDQDLNDLVGEYREKVLSYKEEGSPLFCMLQGEFVFTFRLVTRLKQDGVTVLAGCSKRIVREERDEDGHTRKQSLFVFVGFREY